MHGESERSLAGWRRALDDPLGRTQLAVFMLSSLGAVLVVLAISAALDIDPLIRTLLCGVVFIGTPAVAATVRWWIRTRPDRTTNA
jgi:hypothetical protein